MLRSHVGNSLVLLVLLVQMCFCATGSHFWQVSLQSLMNAKNTEGHDTWHAQRGLPGCMSRNPPRNSLVLLPWAQACSHAIPLPSRPTAHCSLPWVA